jgi:hypothetical protein
MDGLLGTTTMSLVNYLNAAADRLNGAADQQRRKADAEASRAATRVIPVDMLVPALVGHEHDTQDDGRSPPTVLLADTLARHAPPVRDLTRSTREVATV